MIVRTETIKIYSLFELPEKVQRRAWANGSDFSGDYSDDFENTLVAFEKAFDVSVHSWHVDDYTFHYSFVMAGAAADAPDGDPLRFARYLWNNYADEIKRGKYYGKLVYNNSGECKHVKRYSRCTFERDNCPLTGCCFDYDILQPVLDCLYYRRAFVSMYELIDACLDAFFRAWRANIEFCGSFEYFAEQCENNNFEFTETGERWL